MTFKKQIKKALPHAVKDLIHLIRKNIATSKLYTGDYPNWAAAQKDSTGYDSEEILSKVKNAILEVKEGRAAMERDSVLFSKIEYRWPVLTCLFKIASENEGMLDVLDFGGSLGSSYFQYKDTLKNIKEIKWSVIEQDEFVRVGKEAFESETLKFYHDVNECKKGRNPSTLLLSSSIQYLEKPYDMLEILLQHKFKYIIFDRTPFNGTNRDQIRVQHVPKTIYNATYPVWFLNKEKFMNLFSKEYHLEFEFDCEDDVCFPNKYMGYFFKRN